MDISIQEFGGKSIAKNNVRRLVSSLSAKTGHACTSTTIQSC